MRLICPSCGGVHSAEAWANDEDARLFMLALLEFPGGTGKAVLSYLALFRPQKTALRWSKALRLAAELKELIEADTISWDGKRVYKNNAEFWKTGIEKLTGNPPRKLPLENHNYLRAVVYDVADAAAEQSLKKKEDTARNPYRSFVPEEEEFITSDSADGEKVRELLSKFKSNRK